MDGLTNEALKVRGQSINRRKGKYSSGRSISRGNSKARSRSPVQLMSICYKCGKPRYYRRDCKSKGIRSSKGSKEI